jgi:L,D-transpeptidase ErfK/SrfK
MPILHYANQLAYPDAYMEKYRMNAFQNGTRGARLLLGLLMTFSAGAASAQTYELPPAGDDLVGQVKVVKARHRDTLSDIARMFHLGYEEIVRANPRVDPWLPGAGTRVILPMQHILPDAPREGLVLNLPEMRLYYFPKPSRGKPPTVVTFPVSIGRMDWATPLGLTRVTAKITNPAWYPPASIRAEHEQEGRSLPLEVPAGPDNPLGQYALQLGRPGYLIHGTDRPYGVGMRVTHGCIRLYPEDIQRLFDEVPVGTPVRIVNQPYKTGWHSGVLYFEAQSPLEENLAEATSDLTPAVRAIIDATRQRPARVDWNRVTRAAIELRGIPIMVSE